MPHSVHSHVSPVVIFVITLLLTSSVIHAAAATASNNDGGGSATRIAAIMQDPANADLFAIDETMELPKAEKWKCADGSDFTVYDQSRRLWLLDFARALEKFKQVHHDMLGALALEEGYPISVVAMAKRLNERMPLPNSLTQPSFGCDVNGAMILLPGVITREAGSFRPFMTWGAWGHGGFGGYRSADMPGSFYNHGYGWGYSPGFGFSGPVSYEDRSKLIDWDGTADAYGRIVGRKNNLKARNILEEGIALLMQTQRMQKRAGLHMNVYLEQKYTRPAVDLGDPVPLRDLLDRNYRSYYRAKAGTAFAFAHLCIASEKNAARWKDAFVTFLLRTSNTDVTEDMFRDCFGIGFEEMDQILAAHMKSLLETPGKWSLDFAPPKNELANVKTRVATDAEVGRVKAQMFMGIAKRMAAGSRVPNTITQNRLTRGRELISQRTRLGSGRAAYAERARLEIFARFKRGNVDARLLAVAGDWERDFGDAARSIRYYALAADAGVDMPGVYLALARDEKNKALAAGRQLDEKTFSHCARLLDTAVALKPAREDVLSEFLDICEKNAAKPPASVLDTIEAQARAFPYNYSLLYRAASLLAGNGRDAGALALVELGKKATYKPDVLARFDSLRARLGGVGAQAIENGAGIARR